MDDDERVEVLYHGTSLDAAMKIVADGKFDLRETFFAQTRGLAFYFAARTCSKAGRGARQAVVRVSLYHTDFIEWKRGRFILPSGFDEGDAPALRGKTQLRVTAEGVRRLNIHSFRDEWTIETAE